jgi:hypothetical protein
LLAKQIASRPLFGIWFFIGYDGVNTIVPPYK